MYDGLMWPSGGEEQWKKTSNVYMSDGKRTINIIVAIFKFISTSKYILQIEIISIFSYKYYSTVVISKN